MNKLTLVFALTATATATPTAAQSDVVVVSPSHIEMMPASTAQTRLDELEDAYQAVRISGPRAGLVVSPLVIVGGALTAFAGAFANSCFFSVPDGRRCRSREGNIMVGVGVTAIAAGIIGFGISAVRLRRAKEERRRLEWEMGQLRRSLP